MVKRRGESESTHQDSPRLTSDEQEQRIRNILLGQLSRSMKTRYQLQQVLIRKECDPELFEPILDRYEEAQLIDDLAFARAFVASRIQSRGLSVSAVRRELKARGIDQQIITDVLADITHEDQLEKATELAAKKLRGMISLDAKVASRRVFGFLQRRGYSAALASDAIRRANSQAVN
jgi:regulatory protein